MQVIWRSSLSPNSVLYFLAKYGGMASVMAGVLPVGSIQMLACCREMFTYPSPDQKHRVSPTVCLSAMLIIPGLIDQHPIGLQLVTIVASERE